MWGKYRNWTILLFTFTVSMAIVWSAFTISQTLQAQAAGEWVSLFNGKDLTGWKVYNGKPEVWGVESGVLYCKGSGGGWLMTEKEFADFELRFEFRLAKMGNSGVALRAPLQGDPAYQGMEIQLLDDENWKGLRPEQYCGAIYDVVAPKKHATKPHGEWNSMHIIADGRNITIILNGETVVQANLDNHKDRAQPDPKSKKRAHPGLLNGKGHIGFQSYNYRVDFRNVQIRELRK